MNCKWLMPALTIGAAMMFSACGDDPSATSSTPVVVPDNPGTPAQPDPGTGTEPQQPVAQAYGILPTTANPAITDAWYAAWKGTYYKSYVEEAALYPILAADWTEIFGTYTAAGMYPARIIWDTNDDSYCVIDECTNSYKKRGCTVSEGIGYGMLITLFAGDIDAFNSLWYYSKGYRDYRGGHNLTPWRTGTYSYDALVQQANASSATDADLDIATSLILAYYMTQNPAYLNDAIAIATSIWELEISPTFMIYSGNMATWKKETSAYNLSYFSPIAIKLFALVDPNHPWQNVLDKMYTYMQTVQAAGPGMLPDWSDVNGVAIDPKNGSATKTYWRFFHEAVRIPWRIAWDYYWTQDTRAQQVLAGMNNFISSKTGGDPTKLSAEAGTHIYSAVTGMADSTLKKENLQGHFHGAWCLTGMGGNQAWIDGCTAEFNARTLSGFSYFPHILMTMYSQFLNGRFVKPATLPAI